MSDTYRGACFCGAVTIEATGAPQAMGYCHCASCRSWSASPVNAFTLWAPEALKVTRGEDKIGTYAKTPISERQFCTVCGGHIMSRHPTFGLVDIFAATLPDLPYQPALHVNYGEKVLAIPDRLPKFKDFPEAFGGSGEMLPD
ncbi:MAG: GFA family protein [Acetobacteraceae bacterium]